MMTEEERALCSKYGTPPKMCARCEEWKPQHTEFFKRSKKKGEGWHNLCLTCEQVENHNQLVKEGWAERTKLLKQVNDSVAAGHLIENNEDLLRHVYDLFGGASGVAHCMHQTYMDAKDGGRERVTILKSIVTLVDSVTKTRVEQRDTDSMSLDDLKKEFYQLMLTQDVIDVGFSAPTPENAG